MDIPVITPAKGALASVNILKNKMPVEQAQTLVEIMRSKDLLTTLCGLTGKETELDFSKQGLGAGDAVLIANDIRDNGALENLHIGDNQIPIENMNKIIAIVEAKPAMKVLCAVPFRDKTITELDVSGQSLGVEGALVISRYLENNGALTNLNMSKNALGGHYDNGKWISDMTGIKALAAAFPECK